MPSFQVTRRVPYPAQNVYGIIADVAAYSQFVPLCQGSRVWDERLDGEGCTRFSAELLIVYDKLSLSERFLSDVTCNPDRLTVHSVSDQPPVKHIDNRWRVIPVGEGSCDIAFSIDYRMSSRVLQFALSNAFDYAMRKIMTAFEERARELSTKETASANAGVE